MHNGDNVRDNGDYVRDNGDYVRDNGDYVCDSIIVRLTLTNATCDYHHSVKLRVRFRPMKR